MKYKVSDMSSLRMEKQRLQQLCKVAEEDIAQDWVYLKNNHRRLALGLIFPGSNPLLNIVDSAKEFMSGALAGLMGHKGDSLDQQQKQVLLQMGYKLLEMGLTRFLIRKFGHFFHRE